LTASQKDFAIACYKRSMEANPTALAEFARDVRGGLGSADQKRLPSKYLYDTLGSALFEAITKLPEYGLTRADERVIRRLSGEISQHISGPLTVVELGSGSGSKTRLLLQSMKSDELHSYRPIDVSREALRRCRQELGDVATVHGFHGGYIDGLRAISQQRSDNVPILLLFLGSSIGNFDRQEARQFICRVGTFLRPGDHLLLGTDLVKPADVLVAAYYDPTGVTAAFNLNVLGRMNRELGANFDLRAFEHQARYDHDHFRIEMHLRSMDSQRVEIPGAQFSCTFDEGETIWTESSHKFRQADLDQMAAKTNFTIVDRWTDEEWPFVSSLWAAHD